MTSDSKNSFIVAPVQFAADVALLDSLALVVLLLAPSEGDEEFRIPVVGDEQLDGDDGEASLLVLDSQVVEFLPREEEPAVADGFVLAPGAPVVLGDVHAPYKELITGKVAVGILQRDLSRPDGLDLGPHQLDAGGIGLQELVIERGPAVLDLYAALCFRHASLL